MKKEKRSAGKEQREFMSHEKVIKIRRSGVSIKVFEQEANR